MKKINKKALIGVGTGLIATIIGVCCMFKKEENIDEDYVEHEVECDEDAEVDETVEVEED